jgi:hypothetical protein
MNGKNNYDKYQAQALNKTDVICCGNLEKMAIDWMILEDGTKLMPFVHSKYSIVKLRVNNCPSCGAYVRDCNIKP